MSNTTRGSWGNHQRKLGNHQRELGNHQRAPASANLNLCELALTFDLDFRAPVSEFSRNFCARLSTSIFAQFSGTTSIFAQGLQRLNNLIKLWLIGRFYKQAHPSRKFRAQLETRKLPHKYTHANFPAEMVT